MTLPLNHVVVDGVRLAYRSVGCGDPIVFLHGNPSSSSLWRHVLRPVSAYGRCVAPDLVGMGGSEPVPDPGEQSYRFEEHQHYLDGLMALLELNHRVVLVGHEWGAVLATDWARRHPDDVRGVVHLETHLVPLTADVVTVVEANAAWMRTTLVPKLFVNGDPGAVLTGRAREECERWPAQREVTVPGTHVLPEDSAPEIVRALADWLCALP